MDSSAFTDVVEGKVTSFDRPLQASQQSREIQFKPSAAEDAEQPSLIKLGRDILIMVFHLVQDTSPKSLKALALVSSEFYHLAECNRHKHLTLSLEAEKIDNSRDCLHHLEKQNLLPAIRFLDISDPGEGGLTHRLRYNNVKTQRSDADQYHDCIDSIVNLIPRMTGLKDLSWNHSTYRTERVPDAVLQTLRSCPKIRLHARVSEPSRYARPGDFAQETNLDVLQNNPNLSKLQASITFYGAKDCLKATRPLKRILVSSPNLRSLSLKISLPSSGCVIYGPPREYCGFGFVEDERLAPLEELTITGYPWGHNSDTKPEKQANRWLHQSGYPRKGSEMDHWAEYFDWSHLQRLKTRYIDFALKIMPKLISLKEVDFTESRAKENITRFYRECPAALEAIGAESLQSITLQGVLRHGSVLRKLRLHTVEDYQGQWAETAIAAASLRSIRDGCPLIEELFVDIARDGDWPWETLDVLASFPRLRHLSICFEVGVKCRDNPVKPYVTFGAAETLYKYLRSRSPKQPSIISHLHIYSGAPPPMGHGYPAPGAFWAQSNSTEFICTLSERDDEAAKGVFEVVCPGLPKGLK